MFVEEICTVFENYSKSLISQDRPTFRSVYKTITDCTHYSKWRALNIFLQINVARFAHNVDNETFSNTVQTSRFLLKCFIVNVASQASYVYSNETYLACVIYYNAYNLLLLL